MHEKLLSRLLQDRNVQCSAAFHAESISGRSNLSTFRTLAIFSRLSPHSDNGLHGPFGDPPVFQFLYSFRLHNFPGSRTHANRPSGPVYTLKHKPKNYGIAIEGVMDLDAVTIPVILTSHANMEPAIAQHSNVPPVPIPIRLTATVSLPDTGVAYNLYRYDDFNKVPVANFNKAAGYAVQSWVIPPAVGETATIIIDTMSDQTVILRAVPASAP